MLNHVPMFCCKIADTWRPMEVTSPTKSARGRKAVTQIYDDLRSIGLRFLACTKASRSASPISCHLFSRASLTCRPQSPNRKSGNVRKCRKITSTSKICKVFRSTGVLDLSHLCDEQTPAMNLKLCRGGIAPQRSDALESELKNKEAILLAVMFLLLISVELLDKGMPGIQRTSFV